MSTTENKPPQPNDRVVESQRAEATKFTWLISRYLNQHKKSKEDVGYINRTDETIENMMEASDYPQGTYYCSLRRVDDDKEVDHAVVTLKRTIQKSPQKDGVKMPEFEEKPKNDTLSEAERLLKPERFKKIKELLDEKKEMLDKKAEIKMMEKFIDNEDEEREPENDGDDDQFEDFQQAQQNENSNNVIEILKMQMEQQQFMAQQQMDQQRLEQERIREEQKIQRERDQEQQKLQRDRDQEQQRQMIEMMREQSRIQNEALAKLQAEASKPKEPPESTFDKFLKIVAVKPDVLNVFSPKKDDTLAPLLTMMADNQKANMQMFMEIVKQPKKDDSAALISLMSQNQQSNMSLIMENQKQMNAILNRPKEDDGMSKFLIKELVDGRKEGNSDKMLAIYQSMMKDKMESDKEIMTQKFELEKEKIEASYGDPLERKQKFYGDILTSVGSVAKEVLTSIRQSPPAAEGGSSAPTANVNSAENQERAKKFYPLLKKSVDEQKKAVEIYEVLKTELGDDFTKSFIRSKEIADVFTAKGGVLKELLDLVSLK